MASSIDSTSRKTANILDHELSQASYDELTRKLASEIMIKRSGNIKDLVKSKDLTACIVVPVVAEAVPNPDSLKNRSKKEIDSLIQAIFREKGGPTKLDYEPGIRYVCSRRRPDGGLLSNLVSCWSFVWGCNVDGETWELSEFGEKLLSGKINKEDFDKIISDLSWDRKTKNINYYIWELPLVKLKGLSDLSCELGKETLKGAAVCLGSMIVVFAGIYGINTICGNEINSKFLSGLSSVMSIIGQHIFRNL